MHLKIKKYSNSDSNSNTSIKPTDDDFTVAIDTGPEPKLVKKIDDDLETVFLKRELRLKSDFEMQAV